MAERHIEIGILVTRRKLSGPWADCAWLPSGVLAPCPDLAPWTSLGASGADETFFAGPAGLDLHSGAAAHYRDNLEMDPPSIWVTLRPAAGDTHEIGIVTADPYEGEALAESPGEILEAVPMPGAIRETVAAFVAAFLVEPVFEKRLRDSADPEAMASRMPAGRRSR